MTDTTTATTGTTTDTSAAPSKAEGLFPDQGKDTATTATPETKVEGTTTDATTTTTDDTTSTTDAKAEVPEVYTLTAPEGSAGIDEAALNLVTPVLKELGVTNEGAQKLANVFAQVQSDQAARQTTKWLEDAKADKEIGGQAFDANAKLAQEAFAKFGTPELRQFMEATGLGNHPEVLRTFIKIAKAGAQDTHVNADAGGVYVEPAKRLFPNMN